MDIVAMLDKQREEKPLKLAVIELAERCRTLEKQLAKQEQMAKLGEAAIEVIADSCSEKVYNHLYCVDCQLYKVCKLRKEI